MTYHKVRVAQLTKQFLKTPTGLEEKKELYGVIGGSGLLNVFIAGIGIVSWFATWENVLFFCLFFLIIYNIIITINYLHKVLKILKIQELKKQKTELLKKL